MAGQKKTRHRPRRMREEEEEEGAKSSNDISKILYLGMGSA